MSSETSYSALLNFTLPFAWQLLENYGEFYPFGAAIGADGDVIPIGGDVGSEMPLSTDVIDLLRDAFIDGAASGKYTATALVFDVRIKLAPDVNDDKSVAIAVSLDDCDDSVVLYYPYRLDQGQLTIDQCIQREGPGAIFPSR